MVTDKPEKPDFAAFVETLEGTLHPYQRELVERLADARNQTVTIEFKPPVAGRIAHNRQIDIYAAAAMAAHPDAPVRIVSFDDLGELQGKRAEVLIIDDPAYEPMTQEERERMWGTIDSSIGGPGAHVMLDDGRSPFQPFDMERDLTLGWLSWPERAPLRFEEPQEIPTLKQRELAHRLKLNGGDKPWKARRR